MTSSVVSVVPPPKTDFPSTPDRSIDRLRIRLMINIETEGKSYSEGDIITLDNGLKYIRLNEDWVFVDDTFPVDTQFIDARYTLGERVRIHRDTFRTEWATYLKSEMRVAEVWHLVRSSWGRTRWWVRDQEISWWGTCGECAGPCHETDYLCPSCRADM